MSINKYNAEGYYDPTAYEALTQIERAAKQRPYLPLTYICSPFKGDTERNILSARRYCAYAVAHDRIPLAPHLLFPQFLDDNDPAQRELGLFMGLVLLGKCSELWAFGGNITKGMSVEIEKARHRGIAVRYFNESCEEVSA